MKSIARADEAPSVTVVWRKGGAFVAYHQNLVGVRWTGVPSSEQLAALGEAHDAATARGEGVLLVNDVAQLTGATRIDPGAHAQMRQLVERGRAHTRAVAHVIEVPGPVGGVVRAFLGALERIGGRGGTRTACFDRVDAAATWLSRVNGGVGDAEIASTWRAMERAVARSLAA